MAVRMDECWVVNLVGHLDLTRVDEMVESLAVQKVALMETNLVV